MRSFQLLCVGLLSAAALVSCQDNDDHSIWNKGDGVVFRSSIEGVQSRVANNVWTDGDEVGIFMTSAEGEQANSKYLAKADGTLTAAGEELKYPEGTASFVAYYPYSSSLDGKNLKVSVAGKQDLSKADLLYSNNATGISQGTAVNLVFKHQLAKVVVNVKADNTISSTSGLAVSLTGMNTQATLNLADGTLTAADSKAEINFNVDAQGTLAQGIILPTAQLDGAKMVFSLNGKTFEWPVTVSGSNAFEAGNQYVYTANLSILNGRPAVTMGAATITPWGEKEGGNIDVDFEGGSDKPSTEKVLLDEAFDSENNSFTINNVKLPEGGTYVWKWNSYTDGTKYMKASAYIKANKASESWLISPEIDLTAVASKATLEFKHCHKFGADKEKEMTLWIAQSGTNDWKQLTIPTWGTGNDYNYVTAQVDLTAYKGQKVQIAFKYVSTDSAAPTWQIDEVKVTADGEGGGTTPDPDPNPDPTPSGSEIYISEYVEGSSNNKYLELYNPSDKEIDLTGYVLVCATNGKTWDKETGDSYSSSYQPLDGNKIAAKSVLVFKNEKAALYTGEAVVCKACNFNGKENDAVGLFKSGTLIDVFGYPADANSDPNFGLDITYRRKASVNAPAAKFNLDEWEAADKDDVSGLGKR